jgi:cytochrome c oxidase subunit 3
MNGALPLPIDLDTAERWHRREIGLWMFIGTVVMLFAAFTSALIVRKSSGDWMTVGLPQVVWINTAVLLASSATFERARRRGAALPGRALRSLAATGALGALFVVGQIRAWRALADAGLYLPTTPSVSFFYVLTGLHAAHLVAALACVFYVLARTAMADRTGEWSYLARTAATFWHFLAFLWIYVLLLLYLG